MLYRIEVKPSAQKELGKLPQAVRKRIAAQIDTLAANPRPRGVKKLADQQNVYRVRVGDYRVLYTIEDDALLVLIVSIGHRREVYR